jgi:hypothetical protein
MTSSPAGQEREVRYLGTAAIDGAPIAYIVVLAAVVAALSFVPFSVILATGGSFPMSQGIYGLVGWILGPIAGAIANGVGRLVGVFLAPHTAGPAPVVSVWGAALSCFAAGAMALRGKRSSWWIPLAVVFVIELAAYLGRAILVNGVGVGTAILSSFVDWSSVVLFILPTRALIARWIGSKNLGLVSLGLFLGTWMIAGLSHLSVVSITYYIFNWPSEVWASLIPVIPVENLFRCLIGAVIGTGVIAGLRAIGLVKPSQAAY